jgi:hypothetical protein
MSVVSRFADDRMIYPQRRVYTAPEQVNYSGLPYLDPNNLNQKIMEELVPTEYSLPDVKPGQNVYDPTRRPSDNLTIHRMGVPLQCDTYDMLDSRNGASVFHASVPEVHPKLRTPAQKVVHDYVNNLKKEDISFTTEYSKSGMYPYTQNTPETLESMLHYRPPVRILNSIVNEPVGMTFKETFNGSKAHRAMNASALAPADMGQDELRMFAKTGRWC